LIILELCQEYPKPCGCMGSHAALVTTPNAIRTSLRYDLVRNVCMMLGTAWLNLSVHPCKRVAENT
jgi:hypothetical protein